jgi:hypothetical protein
MSGKGSSNLFSGCCGSRRGKEKKDLGKGKTSERATQLGLLEPTSSFPPLSTIDLVTHIDHSIGPKRDHPDYGVSQDELDWKKLKSMSHVERERAIIRRANYYLSTHQFPFATSEAFRRAKREAERDVEKTVTDFKRAKAEAEEAGEDVEKFLDLFEKPEQTLEFDTERINRMFPREDGEDYYRKGLGDRRARYWLQNTDEEVKIDLKTPLDDLMQRLDKNKMEHTKIYKAYNARVEEFGRSEICKRLKELLVPLFKKKNVTKILALGMGTLTPTNPRQLANRWQSQHAALEAIRSVWEEHSKSRLNLPELPIYIQDPQYSELDELIAGAGPHNLKVVNCSFGHQMGWAKVDNSTLVMDFASLFPTFELSLEIARPVAFFSGRPFEAIPNGEEPTIPWSYTLRNEKHEEILIPELGTSGAKFWKIIEEEYEEPSVLNLDGLDFGVPGGKVNDKGERIVSIGADGDTQPGFPGASVLGAKPVLYVYRH